MYFRNTIKIEGIYYWNRWERKVRISGNIENYCCGEDFICINNASKIMKVKAKWRDCIYIDSEFFIPEIGEVYIPKTNRPIIKKKQIQQINKLFKKKQQMIEFFKKLFYFHSYIIIGCKTKKNGRIELKRICKKCLHIDKTRV